MVATDQGPRTPVAGVSCLHPPAVRCTVFVALAADLWQGTDSPSKNRRIVIDDRSIRLAGVTEDNLQGPAGGPCGPTLPTARYMSSRHPGLSHETVSSPTTFQCCHILSDH